MAGYLDIEKFSDRQIIEAILREVIEIKGMQKAAKLADSCNGNAFTHHFDRGDGKCACGGNASSTKLKSSP